MIWSKFNGANAVEFLSKAILRSPDHDRDGNFPCRASHHFGGKVNHVVPLLANTTLKTHTCKTPLYSTRIVLAVCSATPLPAVSLFNRSTTAPTLQCSSWSYGSTAEEECAPKQPKSTNQDTVCKDRYFWLARWTHYPSVISATLPGISFRRRWFPVQPVFSTAMWVRKKPVFPALHPKMPSFNYQSFFLTSLQNV